MRVRAGVIRFAWLVLFFNIGVIALGALVRATGSGAGCGRSWPTCRGEFVPALEGATAIEFLHRAGSGVALVLVFTLAVVVLRTTAEGHPARTGAVLAGVAIVVEALIGAMLVLAEWVADDASPARAVAVPLHLVNTLFLLAALTLTIFWLSGGGRLGGDSGTRRAVIAGGLALVLMFATGAIAALADTLFPEEPLRADFSGDAHFLTRLRILHPILALVGAGIAWWLSSPRGSTRTRSAWLLPVLVGLMLVTGVVNVVLGVPIWMQVVHLLLADALWVSYVWVAAQSLQVAGAPVAISR